MAEVSQSLRRDRASEVPNAPRSSSPGRPSAAGHPTDQIRTPAEEGEDAPVAGGPGAEAVHPEAARASREQGGADVW